MISNPLVYLHDVYLCFHEDNHHKHKIKVKIIVGEVCYSLNKDNTGVSYTMFQLANERNKTLIMRKII